MILLLSGEGVSDLGQCQNAQAQCEPPEFQRGPMAVLAEQAFERRLGYAPREVPGAIRYVSKQALCARAKARQGNRISLIGKKSPGREDGYFHVNAWMLGEIAAGLQRDEDRPVVAILFRDCDGTHSTPRTAWSDKHQSMVDGFRRAGCTRGVPMLPKPKSEAWLLCAAQHEPGRSCESLEDLSGNDAAPESAKRRLDAAFGGHLSAAELCDWLDAHPYDTDRAQSMPSFKAFVDAFDAALNP